MTTTSLTLPADGPAPVYDRTDPGRTGVALVTHHLNQLGIGEHWTQVGVQNGLRIVARKIPPGRGWCQALAVDEALWPAGADLCVQVDWHPDTDIPAAQEDEHWRTRVSAISAALQSAGFTVQAPGPHRTPANSPYMSLLVYRISPGRAPAPCPADGWNHVPVMPAYRWSDRRPSDRLDELLHASRLHGYSFRDLDPFLWPAFSTHVCRVQWDPPVRATQEDWVSAMVRLRHVLIASGYRIQQRWRPWDLTVDRGPSLVTYLGVGAR
ncbi:hypothetical protein [Streptomyces fuscichromogenes]|uniref:Uncharacterized protein n=1 Tax=Streptomyces fuscichromogenes TaxID=1324013 RepID=A0A918CXY1_9ACTN|nr:hypothetical protein [Streptomyces fuscichromogenes]GGN46864.1 hypothetical protein GCM10011578_100050 [Streptomyces fuscichromogenes]